MVKILAVRAVYAGQRPAHPCGISTDSARFVRDESRFRAAPNTTDVRARMRRSPSDEGGQEVGGCPPHRSVRRSDEASISEVYSCADPHLYPLFDARVYGWRRTDGPHAPGSPGMPWNPGAAVVAPTRRRYGPPWRPCTRITARRTGFLTPQRPASLASAVTFGMRSAAGSASRSIPYPSIVGAEPGMREMAVLLVNGAAVLGLRVVR